MKKRLQTMDVKDKRIILRVDYNVPMKNGVILDDSKIRVSLKTIQYLLEQNCRIVLLSHLGKIKSEVDKQVNSLEPIALRLKELLGREVYFSKENFGPNVMMRVSKMQPQDILMLENTRFLDFPNRLESNCNPQIAEFWASLGDVFVNDAFGSTHRKHASTYGISTFLPSCIGFLVQKEIEMLDKYIRNPKHPFTVIMGGAKMDDKILLMESLLPQCDFILCGGGIANTCLQALYFNIGESIATRNPAVLEDVKKMLLSHKEKFMLPLDAIVGSTYDRNYVKYKLINKIEDNELIYDIGVKTLEKYKTAIIKSQTVFINGTVGMYENMKFANGTKELLSILKNSSATIVAGGGDAEASIRKFGFENDITYISSGGGATLEYLASGKLLALEAIEEEGSVIETLDM